MDGNRFDDLSRRLAAGVSRRQAVKGAVAGLLGAIGLRGAADAQVTQVYCGNVVCGSNPGVCKPGCVCCVWSNGNSRCMPPGSCSGTIVTPTTTTTAAPTTTTTTAAPTTTTTTAAPTTTTTTTTTPAPLPNGSACSAPTECGSANCCQSGTVREGLCGVADGGSCGTNNDCCSASCIEGLCGQPRGVGAACDVGDDADCEAALTCCDNLGTGADFICRDLTSDPNNCGACNNPCAAGEVCDNGVCLLDLGQTCAASTECASDTCCASGTPRAGLCGLLDGAVCGQNNNACCSGACVGGVCAPKGSAGSVCDVGDSADCQTGLTCCDSVSNDPGDFVCRDLSVDSTNCGSCGNACPAGQICDGGSCVCEFAECDSGCCPNDTDVCLGMAGSTTCGAPQALGAICFADDEQCASGNCARVQNISSGTTPVCCSPIGGPCSGGGTSTHCCDDGIDGTNTAGNAASCSGSGVCCVTNNFACTSVSQCCQQGSFGACAPTNGVQRCCLIAGGFCGGGIRCCDGFTCSGTTCVAA
jgi:hypothetical protein